MSHPSIGLDDEDEGSNNLLIRQALSVVSVLGVDLVAAVFPCHLVHVPGEQPAGHDVPLAPHQDKYRVASAAKEFFVVHVALEWTVFVMVMRSNLNSSFVIRLDSATLRVDLSNVFLTKIVLFLYVLISTFLLRADFSIAMINVS